MLHVHAGIFVGALVAAFMLGWLGSEALFRREWREMQRIAGFDELLARVATQLERRRPKG